MMSWPQSVARRYWIQWQQKNCLGFIISIAADIMSWLYQAIACVIEKVKILYQSIACVIEKVKTLVLYACSRINKTKRNNYYIIQSGNSCNAHMGIIKKLDKHVPGLTKVNEVEKCNVILVICPIVSRAGTDIQAALDQLNACSESKPAVFMVFHHTFEREKVLPDSSRFINRENTLTVNCLFNEDEGLLACDMNDLELDKIIQYLKPQNTRWYRKRDAYEESNA